MAEYVSLPATYSRTHTLSKTVFVAQTAKMDAT